MQSVCGVGGLGEGAGGLPGFADAGVVLVEIVGGGGGGDFFDESAEGVVVVDGVIVGDEAV